MLTMKGLRVFSRKVPYDGLPKQHLHRPDRRPLGLVGSSPDSPLEGDGFELVWGFPCQVVFFGLLPVLCSEREGPFFIPSPTIRFPHGVVCHERRMSYQRRATVREMKEGPSSSVIRSRSQATASCCGQKPWW